MSEPRQWPDTAGSPDYPANTDPAYSGQYWTPNYYGQGYGAQSYGQGYAPGYGAPTTQPTEQLPTYWQTGTGYQPGTPPPPPQPPKSPRWLWILAAAAVLLVAALVLALVIVSNSSREATTVAPANPGTTSSRSATTSPAPTRVPLPTATRPVPTIPSPSAEEPIPTGPDQTTSPVGTEVVVYTVNGEGRAINITYVDTGGVMQTEFNVALPWSKEVSLSAPAKNSASVAVVNVGRDVTCSVSVNGSQVRQRTGRGLTICSGLG